ncbi:adhesion G protein-coupled receptor L3-like [Centroberyx affinis]|uniref:adhesion G protein-coupled receptor L3-like n=1 Tax=Centroberyx affinis TaxID=166261 RepID=UPI003A5C45B3
MLCGDEDKVMKASGTFYRGPPCFHTSYFVRVKNSKPGTHVRCPCWFQIALLVFLLIGHASCNHTSTTSLPPLTPTSTTTLGTTRSTVTSPAVTPVLSHTNTTNVPQSVTTIKTFSGAPQTTVIHNITKEPPVQVQCNSSQSCTNRSVYYWLEVTVYVTGEEKNESDISTWLHHLFQNQLERCVSPNHTEPNATTSDDDFLQTTSVSPSYEPTHNMTTSLLSYNTTTTTPYNVTTATLTNYSLTASSTNFSMMTTLYSSTATIKPSTNVTSSYNHSTPLDANYSMMTSSWPHNTTGEMGDGGMTGINLFQGIEVSCSTKTAIRKTKCTVLLKLKQPTRPCCILRSLCRGGKNSTHIHVVGERAERVGRLPQTNGHMECNSFTQDPNICFYTGAVNGSCEESGTVYVAPEKNSTHCGIPTVKKKASCNCSAYCNGTAAYYYLQISIQDRTMNFSYVSSLISRLKTPPPCSTKTNSSCPLSIIASEYTDSYVNCGGGTTNLHSCNVIVSFAHKVPVCAVSTALLTVLQSEEHIHYDGKVTRAAICGDSGVSGNPLKSNFTWVFIDLKPSEFCLAEEYVADILSCQKGQNKCVLLKQQCDKSIIPPFTTASPNATTSTLIPTSVQQNTTSPSVNVTSSPLNTTAAAPNTTTAANVTITVTAAPNTTTATGNATISLNTTTSMSPTISMNTTIFMNTTTSMNTMTSMSPTISMNTTTSLSPTISTNTTISVNTTIPTGTTISTGPTVVPATNITEPLTTAGSTEGQANALLELTRNVSNLNSSQVDQLVSQLEALLAGPTVSLALGNTSIHIVSNLLDASPDTVADSSNRIIGIVDTVGLKLEIEGEAETILSQGLALSVKTTDGSNFEETSFSISDPNNVQVRGDPRTRRSVRTKSSIPQGSIRLPPSLTQDLTTQEQQQASRVQFNFYQKSTVFQDRSLGERRLISGVLGASVANLSITGLEEDIVIHLRNTEPIPANFVASCVFWDFTRNDGSGGWNPNGCFVRNSTDNETICGCNHLTSFAILLDLSRQPLTSRLQATILTYITYIGCGISAIFLAVTLLTYLAFGKLRKDIPSKILIQLCLALLLLNLVFLVDSWLALYPEAVGLCISTAWFLHYFLLASFTWMGLEAIHMYLALVKVFNSYVSRYMLKFSLVGWGIPLLVVIIVIAVDKDNYGLVTYGKFTDGSTDDFCWLKNDIAFYVAVVAYFCVIFLFNLIMFVVVMVQLCRIKRQNPHNVQHRGTLQDMRSMAGITILLGLTWGFAFFAWGPVNLAFMYLFAIFNSLQGFFIFVFHCAVKENVRRQWRTYLCCGKLRLAENSEWSRTATQKTVKKSSVTRVTSLHSFKSSQSNNSSSSSSFLVSDSSEQLSGVGSPFEDRAITADEEPSSDVILNELNRQYRNQQTP